MAVTLEVEADGAVVATLSGATLTEAVIIADALDDLSWPAPLQAVPASADVISAA